MLLAAMQSNLATLYETPLQHRISDFLITDSAQADRLQPGVPRAGNSERLLLRESTDGLDISLYIDSEILDTLAHFDPYDELNNGNLNDFLIALEGVSHFNYVTWNATHERAFTQLELELQAEVDKFISAMMLFDKQAQHPVPEDVHARLFEEVTFSQTQDTELGRRYRDANHLAGRYCKSLLNRFPGQHREPAFINELRRFYRFPQNQKIRRIQAS
jgi:hypothetical protein